MRIIADLDDRKHAFIIGSISCCQLEEPQQIRFLVDTGASLTTILSYDALRLGIDCIKLKLKEGSFNTANGERRAYELPKTELKLNANDDNSKEKTITFHLESIPCFAPPERITESIIAGNTYSLLGMDILYLFKKWEYTDKTLIIQ